LIKNSPATILHILSAVRPTFHVIGLPLFPAAVHLGLVLPPPCYPTLIAKTPATLIPWHETPRRESDEPTSGPTRGATAPKRPTRARRCNFTFTYFRASSGLSGDACEQRGFSKVMVFLQPFSSERFFASADEDKTIAEKRKQHHRFSAIVLTKNDVRRQRPEKEKESSEGCRADPRKATTNHGHTDLYCEPSAAQRARTQQARQTRQQQTSGQETKNDPTSGHLKVKILIQPLDT